ncbi:ATP-binding protein [Cryobacterium sp. N21]|uniref:ATP-binding protein n=1 Tax=Cryobacterium sp. N21 TaxID=2048289 RepID=UPI002711DB4D|nr:ATP-binding protein [Cryobacterium sp. N21]
MGSNPTVSAAIRTPESLINTGTQGFSFTRKKRSLIITTSHEFSRGGTVFGDDNMAAAAIDRIVHHGRLLQLRGESYRVKHALMK